MPGIPLLQLPLLVISKIIEDFEVEDVLYLSLFSKRARRITKMCWKQEVPLSIHVSTGGKKRAEILVMKKRYEDDDEVDFEDDGVYTYENDVEILADEVENDEELFKFNIHEGRGFPNREHQKITLGDVVVPSVRSKNYSGRIRYETFWPNRLLGIMNTVSHLTELFGCKVTSLCFCSSEQQSNQIIDWVMSRQESIMGCTASRVSDETLAHLLNNCKITDNLRIYGQPSREFRHTWSLNMNCFCAEDNLFLTYKDIMAMNCQHINIKKSELTSECANKFLKNWLNGGNARLESALIIMDSVDRRRIFEEIEVVQQPRTLGRYYLGESDKRIPMRGGYDIKRNDGTIGTVFLHRFQGVQLPFKMTTGGFPLLRLPYLALCQVWDHFSPYQIIQFSLYSKRSQLVAKKCWKKKRTPEVELSVGEVSEISVYFYGEANGFNFMIYDKPRLHNKTKNKSRIGEVLVSSITMGDCIKSFWMSKFKGIVNTGSHIMDLFTTTISKVNFISENHANEYKPIIDWIMSRQEYIQGCKVEIISDESLAHLLDNCKITKDLTLYGTPNRNLSFNWKINMDSFYIHNGSILTCENLMSMNCQYLHLNSSSLTSKDLNRFLKHWQNGGSFGIQFAIIRMNFIDRFTLFAGIEAVYQPRRVERAYSYFNKQTIVKKRGVDIRRNDGETGTIFFNGPMGFEFAVGPREVIME
ncbi:unnamed protein product [Caenorhabditis brenneri]